MAQLVARLVRNEKVGGSNPPSSTTGRHPIRMSVFCMHGCVVAAGSAGVPGAGGPAVGPGCLVCPWAAARPRAVRAASLRLGASSRSPARPRRRPRAPQPCPPVPPASSTPAMPGLLTCGWARRLEARPGPAAAHGHRSQTLRPLRRSSSWWCLVYSAISHVIPSQLVQTLNSPRWDCNVFGWSRKVTVGNYVRNLSGVSPADPCWPCQPAAACTAAWPSGPSAPSGALDTSWAGSLMGSAREGLRLRARKSSPCVPVRS